MMNIPISKIGMSITEGGREGTFIDSIQTAIKTGVSAVELSARMEGPGVGFESYGRTARRDLKEVALANQVRIVSVHVPVEIGNLSGFTGNKGFSDELRKAQVDEVKKAIDFGSQVSNGCAIVVHTGEFSRPLSEQPWCSNNRGDVIFTGYEEEQEKAVITLVDISTGHVVETVKKNQKIPRAEWNKHEGTRAYRDLKGNIVNKGDYIDYDGNKVSRKDRLPKYDKKRNTFILKDETWEDFIQEAHELNTEFEKTHGRKPIGDEVITPEEAFLFASTETQEKIAKGYALYYGRHLDKQFELLSILRKVKEFYDRLEKSMPEHEKWRLMRQDPLIGGIVGQLIPPASKMPSELLNTAIRDIEEDIKSTQNLVVGQEQAVRKQQIIREQTTAIRKYGLKQSIKSYVEVGVYAMDATHAHNLKQDIFIAPENLFPEMGYGTHPDELIEMVEVVRRAMAEYLVKHRNISSVDAQKESEDHIKATLDTQHLGMWRKYFRQKCGELKKETDSRFNDWYLEQIKKIANEDIVGHIHLVEGFGMGHSHLAVEQGAMPVKSAIKYLIESGYKGTIISEAYGENAFGAGRQVTETWKQLGGTVNPKTGQRWKDIEKSHFGKEYPPAHITDKDILNNDGELWSGVPLG